MHIEVFIDGGSVVTIDEVSFWLLVIIVLCATLVAITVRRISKLFSRRCTEDGCHSLRVKRIHKIILLERPHGFWWNWWMKVETFTISHCRKCGKEKVEKFPTKHISRLHILSVRLTAWWQFKIDTAQLERLAPGRDDLWKVIQSLKKPPRLPTLRGGTKFVPKDLDVK